MIHTFLDAGVLIAAARGQGEMARTALAMLVDPEREFGSSQFIQIEVLPKPMYHRRMSEVAFLELFFDQVARWAEPLEDVAALGQDLAAKYGLAGMDALHVAAAILTGSDELVTTERLGKPIHRMTEIAIMTIHAR